MKFLRLASWIAFVGVTACSSGGSGSPTPAATSAPTPTAKVRFVNATTKLGAVTFSIGMQQLQVALGSASAATDVPAGAIAVSALASTAVATKSLSLAEGSQNDLVAYESPAGVLNVESLPGQATNPDSTKTVVAIFAKGFPVAIDAYLVAPGTSIRSLVPTISGGDGTQTLAPGTYILVLAPAGSKTASFVSKPLTLGGGQRIVIFVLSNASNPALPAPLALPFDGAAQPFTEGRSEVKVLKRIDTFPGRYVFDSRNPLPQAAPSSISVDGAVVAQLPSALQPGNVSYFLEPGAHTMVTRGAGSEYDSRFDAAPGMTYVQRFGWWQVTTITNGYSWLQPDAAPDYPAPPDKARVRLNTARACETNTVVRVDGAIVNQAASPVAIDRAAGPMQLEVSIPGGTAQVTIALTAGHYYVVQTVDEDINFGFPSCEWALELSSD